MTTHTDYLSSVYYVDKFQDTADRCLRMSERVMKEHPFDAIAFTGTSGAAMAYVLSLMMHLPLICIRKETEGSHFKQTGMGLVEGYVASRRYMIVDDLISSGGTMRAIYHAVRERMPLAEPVAIVLYNTYTNEPDMWHPQRRCHTFYKGAQSMTEEVLVPIYGCKP